jgi:dTDP-4-dehydrorhamnose reductase
MKILVTGANGMVARAAIRHCGERGYDVRSASRSDLDISDRDKVLRFIETTHPEVVFNCAAYTNVDGAETNEQLCYAANSDGPENLALACREVGALLLTISTDYVFGGEKSGFYTEDDEPRPLGVYAKSKYEGEQRAAAADPAAMIIRSGWIYGPGGTNFLSVMPSLLMQGRTLTAVSDSEGTPTYAVDLVRRMRELAEIRRGGIYHVTNTGEGTTYFGFGRKICEIEGLEPELLSPVTDVELKRPAPRPANSKMRSVKESVLGLEPLPEWSSSLAAYLRTST